MTKYIIMLIGCIECGVPSYPIAITETEEEATAIVDEQESTWKLFGGDGYYAVFETAMIPVYSEAVKRGSN